MAPKGLSKFQTKSVTALRKMAAKAVPLPGKGDTAATMAKMAKMSNRRDQQAVAKQLRYAERYDDGHGPAHLAADLAATRVELRERCEQYFGTRCHVMVDPKSLRHWEADGTFVTVDGTVVVSHPTLGDQHLPCRATNRLDDRSSGTHVEFVTGDGKVRTESEYSALRWTS